MMVLGCDDGRKHGMPTGMRGLRACVSVVALLRVSALVCTVCLSSRMSCPELRVGASKLCVRVVRKLCLVKGPAFLRSN